jgi:hypothetical protein
MLVAAQEKPPPQGRSRSASTSTTLPPLAAMAAADVADEEDQHWTAAVLAGHDEDSGDRQDSGYGGRRRSDSSSSNSLRGRGEAKLAASDESPTKHRSSSLETRSVGAYYKHLGRFNVQRTGSWVDLDEVRKSPMPTQLPVILKPLKILRPRSRAAKPKWVYGNPWASDSPKVVREAEGDRIRFFPSAMPPLPVRPRSMGALDTESLTGGSPKKDRAGDKRVIRSQQTRRVWRPSETAAALVANGGNGGATARKNRRRNLRDFPY